jgi:hypothetical protein
LESNARTEDGRGVIITFFSMPARIRRQGGSIRCGRNPARGKYEAMTPMKKSIQNWLDGDTPWDVPQWIIEFHSELDDPNLTPLRAVRQALTEIQTGHCWIVCHVRSGLTWSVNLEREEIIELATKTE